MNRPLVTPPPATRAGFVYLAGVGASLVLLFTAAVVGIFTDSAQNKQQDRLLGCFDTYASTQSSSSTVIREKSVARDAAIDWFIRANARYFSLFDQGASFDRKQAAFGQVVRAGARAERKSNALELARMRNPVPKAPSTFCEVDP